MKQLFSPIKHKIYKLIHITFLFYIFSWPIVVYSKYINYTPARIPEKLFIIAKQSILDQIKTNKQKSFKHIEYSDIERGIFVRLINKTTDRGCIGFVRGVSSLEQAVKIAAINAAFFDARYKQISAQEFSDLIIEITIIGRLEQIKNYNDFKLGYDSIYIIDTYGKAIMQAQIASEKNWDKEDFLKAICIKAKIDEFSYKKTRTKIFRTSTVFKRMRFNEINIDK